MTYYLNKSKYDLILSDLSVVLKSGCVDSILRLNPKLTPAQIHESEQIGSLSKALKANKIVKSAPVKQERLTTKLKESLKPIPSRVKTGLTIDPKQKQYIEELVGTSDLSKFEDYADGFSEPEITVDEEVYEAEPPQSPPTNSRYIDLE